MATIHANARGNTVDRRKRRQWLLDTFGNGNTAPCWQCGKRVNRHTLVVDRKRAGGSYRRSNIRVHCWTCSSRQGQQLKGRKNAANSMRVRISDTRSVRTGGVPKSVIPKLFVLLLVVLLVAVLPIGLAIPIVVGFVIGTVVDMRGDGIARN